MTQPITRALVTGASGLIGIQLCRALAHKGIHVCATAMTPDSLQSLASKQIAVLYGDITDPSFINTLLSEAQPQVVFHLAAYGTYGYEKDVHRMITVNIEGTRLLLEASAHHGCQSFVFAGSVKEYAPSRKPITETQPLQPWDDYAVTKAAASFLCRLAAYKYQIPITTLRLSPVYGPGDTKSRFVMTAIAAALEKTPFTLSVGSLVRNFTYVDDSVAAFLAAMNRSGDLYEEFNIGSKEPASFQDILTTIETITGKPMQIQMVEPPSPTDDSWVVNIHKAQQLLGWKPQVDLTEGMKRTISWYTKTP